MKSPAAPVPPAAPPSPPPASPHPTAAPKPDDSTTTKDTPTKAASSQPDGEKTAASSTGQATAAATSGSGSLSGSGADELKKLAKSANQKTFTVSYDMEVTGADKKATKGKMTFAQKPPKSYTAFETTEGPSDSIGSFIIIDDGTNSFLCSSSGADKSCLKSKSGGGTASDVFSLNSLISSIEGKTEVTALKDQKIAGADSKCFRIKDSTSEGTACFAKDSGILTLADGVDTDASKTTIRANKVATNVDDKIFEPPKDYTVTDLG